MPLLRHLVHFTSLPLFFKNSKLLIISQQSNTNRCAARLAERLDVGRLKSVSTVADEEQLGRRVTRSDYLRSTEWKWEGDLREQALGGRGKKGGAARSRAAV